MARNDAVVADWHLIDLPKPAKPDGWSWSELAALNHATQLEAFGFCGCEDSPAWYADCPNYGEDEE